MKPAAAAASLASAVALALAFVCLLLPLQNPDLWWHLSAGRWILEHRALPRADFLSHTRFAVPWVDFEWLTQAVYYLVHRAAGFQGLLALRVVLLSGALAAGGAAVALHGWGRGPVCAAVLVLAAALMPVSDLRPDNFSLLFFALLLLALEARRLDRLRYSPVFWLGVAALFALWANLHLALLYGLILAGAYMVGEIAQAGLPVVYGRGKWGNLSRARDYLGVVALGTAAGFLNPYSSKLIGVLREHHDALALLQEFICEWQSPDVTQMSFWPYWALLLAVFGSVLRHWWLTRSTPLGPLIALLYFGLASGSHQRHLSYLSLTAMPLLAMTLPPRSSIAWCGGLLAGAHVLFLAAPHTLAAGKPLIAERASRLAAFLEEEKAALGGRRLYNQWGDGGYLGYRLAPDHKVFFDGRYIFHDLLFQTKEAFYRPGLWKEHFDKHGVELALMRRLLSHASQDKVGRFVVPRPYWVKYMPEQTWALVYWDEDDMIFARRSAVDAAWIKRHEWRWVRPDDDAWLELMVKAGKAPRKEVEKEQARASGR